VLSAAPAGEAIVSAAPRLTVIVATRDRPRELFRTLSVLDEEALSLPFEAVVVDLGSGASMTGVVEAAATRFPCESLWLPPAEASLGNALRIALDAARTPRVLVLGEGVVPRPGLLEAHAELAPPETCGLGIWRDVPSAIWSSSGMLEHPTIDRAARFAERARRLLAGCDEAELWRSFDLRHASFPHARAAATAFGAHDPPELLARILADELRTHGSPVALIVESIPLMLLPAAHAEPDGTLGGEDRAGDGGEDDGADSSDVDEIPPELSLLHAARRTIEER
jgi:hypothetical protein